MPGIWYVYIFLGEKKTYITSCITGTKANNLWQLTSQNLIIPFIAPHDRCGVDDLCTYLQIDFKTADFNKLQVDLNCASRAFIPETG